jgi:hypothetical protein
MTTSTTRRPGVVTFVGVIIVLQGFLAAVAGIALIAFQSSDRLQEAVNQTGAALLGSGIAELVVAALYLLVGFGILQGSKVSRFLVAMVQGIGMALATWLLLTHHTGAYTTRSLVTLLIGTFVLWALYGHHESDAYFETQS